MFIIDDNLSRLKKIDLKSARAIDEKKKNVNIGIHGINIHVTDNQTGQVTLINKNTYKTTHFKNPETRIDNTNLISDQSLIGRSTIMKDSTAARQLTKLNYLAAVVDRAFLLKKQVDGYFCTDGLLRYDASQFKLIYMYVYRGEFLCLDTNLNLLYKSKTVDTIKTADVTVKKIVKNGKLVSVTQSKPPKPVNRNFVLYKNLLFMFSTIKADNERDADFEKNQIIDVYTIDKGKYQYSFYIPKYMGIILRDFRVKDDFMFAIFGSHLLKFKIGLEPG
ncbi:hypothetical protein D3C87_1230000 [compost metagenome]